MPRMKGLGKRQDRTLSPEELAYLRRLVKFNPEEIRDEKELQGAKDHR